MAHAARLLFVTRKRCPIRLLAGCPLLLVFKYCLRVTHGDVHDPRQKLDIAVCDLLDQVIPVFPIEVIRKLVEAFVSPLGVALQDTVKLSAGTHAVVLGVNMFVK